ncbi:uncharacterized protein LOC106172224 [Lingula anatina]|uniref:Uncharacterized protein LOC106172224 n=1 Tax=Lingula anatina TaxID=7574 RepID=A0A1S3JEJ1_LINAN|nr:uncharacterized protein LOC106172224 [Lingula anatina]|eukprot:XP_013408309.1 uncharacterized protein LOC106172224 [Lingula anatina]
MDVFDGDHDHHNLSVYSGASGDSNDSIQSNYTYTPIHIPDFYFYIPVGFCLFGVFENIISLVALAHVRRQGDALYLLLGNLCVVDILLLIFAVVYYIISDLLLYRIENTDPRHIDLLCFSLLFKSFFQTTVFAEAFTTVGLVVFTTLKVLQPLRSLYLLHPPWIWIPISAIWLLSSLMGFAIYILAAIRSETKTFLDICTMYVSEESLLINEHTIAAATIGVSVVVVALCYIKVIHIARNAKRRHRYSRYQSASETSISCRPAETRFSLSESNAAYSKRQQCVVFSNGKDSGTTMAISTTPNRRHSHDSTTKVAMTAVLLFGVLLVFWIPYVVIGLLRILDDMLPAYVVTTLFLLNAILDPLIYGIRLRRMRSGYELMFKRCFAFFKRKDLRSLHSHRSTSFSRATQVSHTRRLSSRNGSASQFLPRQSSASRFQ